VVGDFEDSDLCLKLGERGGVCWYMASVALFHFERQSMPKSGLHSERGSSVYNRLLHTAKWSARIETIMKQALV
jgi:GT2 family glycosyltransferase